jgi:hypothetical protein
MHRNGQAVMAIASRMQSADLSMAETTAVDTLILSRMMAEGNAGTFSGSLSRQRLRLEFPLAPGP